MRFNTIIKLFLCSLSLVLSQAANAEDLVYSPYAAQDGDKNVYWGDTHLHTTLSLDARAFGVTLDVEDAYRFARGDQIISTHGQPVRLARPLDFVVVSDHSDAMGTMSEIIAGNPRFMKDKRVSEWRARLNDDDPAERLKARMEVMTALTDGGAPDILLDTDFAHSIWVGYVETADRYNQPGHFTTIIGYEWTSSEGGDNLHRNVLYRDSAEKAKLLRPFTTVDSNDPRDLWKWMAQYERETQGQVFALAHNGNISNGLMFPSVENSDLVTEDYAKMRARWEPLYEVTQIKGDGETHPLLSPNDEFADYETWDLTNFKGVPKTPDMLQYEYARSALRMGLQIEAETGTNPYQFGMVGSTDSHTGLATADEDNFFGKLSYLEPKPTRWTDPLAKVGDIAVLGWQMVASGYAAVWATDNSREAIFDAMMRRETYATTGPRMKVRFDVNYNNISAPMGSSIKLHENGNAPVFSVMAQKDPMDGNLDRIQVVKGWLAADGSTQEQVFNVVWSGDRKLDTQGELPAVGSTVDIANASYQNSIGAVELSTQWSDPTFNAEQNAFYYVRVLQIPTPRWTAYDAKAFGVTMDEAVPMTTQERAYTSPIWFTR